MQLNVHNLIIYTKYSELDVVIHNLEFMSVTLF